MRNVVLAAGLAMATTGAVEAATVSGAGYSWEAADGGLSLFVGIGPGEDFFSTVDDGRLAYASGVALGSSLLYWGASRDYVGGELHRDKGITESIAVENGICERVIDNLYYADISYRTGVLSTGMEQRVRAVYPEDTAGNNATAEDCNALGDGFWVTTSQDGRWRALNGAPQFPFTDVAAVPLPAGLSLLFLGLGGLGLVARRGRQRRVA